MFVAWIILRELIKTKKIKVWAHTRARHLTLIVTWFEDRCYVTEAVDVHRDMAFVDKSNPMLDVIKRLPVEIPDATHVALTHNGICWEVAGLAYNLPKELKDMSESEQASRVPKVIHPSKCVDYSSTSMKEADPMKKLSPKQPSREIVVDPAIRVEKLPKGINLVTMMRPGGHQPIQVKLPFTENHQFWCTIRVDVTETSVKCPDSDLALKVHVLKKAADLAAKEKTTVRIPIKVPGEVMNFGVYAVPGLDTHVFVGPFTSNEAVEKPPVEEEEDPDEIVCLSDESQPPQPMQPKNFVKPDFTKIKRDAIMGQIPQRISQESQDQDDDISIIENEPDSMEETRDLHPNSSIGDDGKSKLEYINPSPNPHGRVVFSPDPVRAQFYESESDERIKPVKIITTGQIIKVFHGKDLVSFMHPKFHNHEVICDNLVKLRQWFQFYLEEGKIFPGNSEPNKGKLSIKPMKDLIDESKKPDVSTKKPEKRKSIPAQAQVRPQDPNRVLNGRKFVCHQISHNGQHGVAIVFDRKNHMDMRKLFFKLNQILASNGVKKVTDSIQILHRARDEIVRLEKLDSDFTEKKKMLMLKRQNLFKEFTNNLSHLPSSADKKQAVLELKEGLKSIKEAGGKLWQGHNAYKKDDALNVRPDPDSKLFPNYNEINHTKEALKSIWLPPQKKPAEMSSFSGPSSSGITPYSDITGLQTTRKDGKVLRPMNAFMLWAKAQRKALIAQGNDGASVSKLLAEKWKSMTSEEQAPYYTEAERLKSLHLLQHPNYKYSPKSKRMGMKKSVAKLHALNNALIAQTQNQPSSTVHMSQDVVMLSDSNEDMMESPVSPPPAYMMPMVTLVEGNVDEPQMNPHENVVELD